METIFVLVRQYNSDIDIVIMVHVLLFKTVLRGHKYFKTLIIAKLQKFALCKYFQAYSL